MTNAKVENIIKSRLEERLKDIDFSELKPGLTEVYVAGNSLNKLSPNDFDVFPVSPGDFDNLIFDKAVLLSKTRNATTVKYEDKVIQFCNYHYPSLKKLVDSFDFAHIKIGARVKNNYVEELYMSEDYKIARLTEGSYYTKSEYPTSSLVRLFKYERRGDFSGNRHIIEALKILTDISIRGFKSYDDFKDQLDAVDLGLVPEDLDGCSDIFLNFYDAFSKAQK